MKKTIIFDRRSNKELQHFPIAVQVKFKALFLALEIYGKLEEPEGKKLAGNSGLFEARVKYQGLWRAVYAYIKNDQIIVLCAFVKKTQKTPKIELEKAKHRLQEYI